jgi:hypothetical protein
MTTYYHAYTVPASEVRPVGTENDSPWNGDPLPEHTADLIKDYDWGWLPVYSAVRIDRAEPGAEPFIRITLDYVTSPDGGRVVQTHRPWTPIEVLRPQSTPPTL